MILVLLLRSSPSQSVSQSYNYEYFYHTHHTQRISWRHHRYSEPGRTCVFETTARGEVGIDRERNRAWTWLRNKLLSESISWLLFYSGSRLETYGGLSTCLLLSRDIRYMYIHSQKNSCHFVEYRLGEREGIRILVVSFCCVFYLQAQLFLLLLASFRL